MKTFLKWITKKEFSLMTMIGAGLVIGTYEETGSLLSIFGIVIVWTFLTVILETIAHG